ncbi:helix-turn-helix domain-containing protein [Streptomyces sp. HPF1205]|uniref:helix-turn-helix domain-containing protein n=1 Tax=Streptomyces sp. HPF1205 TaxID=2873262 RepID=UPI001CEDF490|nr:helix-turn-helix domain-containing protein [Streptomyces sp. HPF1205]
MRTAAAGHRLCAGCRRRLGLGIGQLPGLYRDCERVLGGAPAKGVRERTSGGALPGAPFNAAAAEARAAILGVLGSWSGLVAQERRIAPPPRTVDTLSVFLLRHADWLAAHPAAAEATREVARLVARARRVAHPEQVRRVPLGACVEPGCDGRLSATVRGAGSGSGPGSGAGSGAGSVAAPVTVSCDADPRHSWAGPEWTRLRRLMPAAGARPGGGTGDRWLTAADVSRLWDIPVGTVYRLASEQRWRRHQRSGRTYYAESDAHDCFARRAERSRQG